MLCKYCLFKKSCFGSPEHEYMDTYGECPYYYEEESDNNKNN